MQYITVLRPWQWLKNMMIFFPPFLGGLLLQPGIVMKGALPFFTFCLASSATYIFNDFRDIDNDRKHPDKKNRPLPSGSVSVTGASLLAIILASVAAACAWSISGTFLLCIVAYLGISAAYSVLLKEYPLIDIFCISAGFLLRLEAGGAAFDIRISEWLFLCVFLLSIFLSAGKRLNEKNRLGCEASRHRKALAVYPDGFLDGVMYVTGSSVLVAYSMYLINRHSSLLMYTVPLCCFGLLRFMLRVQLGRGGDPTEALLKDIPLFIVGFAWILMMGWGIYGR